MNIVENKLTGNNTALLTTEIKYFIAAARSTGRDIIKLVFADRMLDNTAKISTVTRILRSVKRQRAIQLFVVSTDIGDYSTETEYLKNKYPDIFSDKTDYTYFLLKL